MNQRVQPASEQEFIVVFHKIVTAMKINSVDPQAQSDPFWILYGMKGAIVRGWVTRECCAA